MADLSIHATLLRICAAGAGKSPPARRRRAHACLARQTSGCHCLLSLLLLLRWLGLICLLLLLLWLGLLGLLLRWLGLSLRLLLLCILLLRRRTPRGLGLLLRLDLDVRRVLLDGVEALLGAEVLFATSLFEHEEATALPVALDALGHLHADQALGLLVPGGMERQEGLDQLEVGTIRLQLLAIAAGVQDLLHPASQGRHVHEALRAHEDRAVALLLPLAGLPLALVPDVLGDELQGRLQELA
mmetsp:Transcript_53829/g.156988  ORF Transcript_53829/g.156988 Transcript_53829/m.156988 type:complete len:243 (+) Transcript_53829:63-791(+)